MGCAVLDADVLGEVRMALREIESEVTVVWARRSSNLGGAKAEVGEPRENCGQMLTRILEYRNWS